MLLVVCSCLLGDGKFDRRGQFGHYLHRVEEWLNTLANLNRQLVSHAYGNIKLACIFLMEMDTNVCFGIVTRQEMRRFQPFQVLRGIVYYNYAVGSIYGDAKNAA
jgi:hypothetical protein